MFVEPFCEILSVAFHSDLLLCSQDAVSRYFALYSFRKLWNHIPRGGKMYQEEILIHRVLCNTIFSHEAYWKCTLNSPYLGKWARTIKNYLKILSFKHNDKNVLLVGCK